MKYENMKNKYTFGVYLTAFHHSERTWQRDSHLSGHWIVRWEEVLKYTPWKIFLYWQADGWSDIQAFYPYPALLYSQETSSFSLDLLCHKATQIADWEVNHRDDKRDEKQEEQVQSLTLGTCSFQLLWVKFSLHGEFIHTWSALSEGFPADEHCDVTSEGFGNKGESNNRK